MHPSRDNLIDYLNGKLSDPASREDIDRHIEICEFCAEFCREYDLFSEVAQSAGDERLTEGLARLRDSLYQSALRSTIVDLKPLTTERPAVSYLAADGASGKQPAIRRVATLYSENPEVVVLVMHDSVKGVDYLQVQAADKMLTAHVMVQLPELAKEYVTDAFGRAELNLGKTDSLETLKWQIRMPEVAFALEPLGYDPDKVEYAKDIVLQTDRHDCIEIRFEGRAEGKQLSIRVVELDGRTDFGSVKLVVTQMDKANLVSAVAGVPVTMGPIDPDTTINIRLYQ